MTKADAELVVNKMAQYDNFFVNLMVTEELGFRLAQDDDEYLLTDAFVMFLSFFGFGSIPLVIYYIGAIAGLSDELLFTVTTTVIVITLFVLGAIKSTFSSVSWIYSGCETLLVGCACAFVAWGVAKAVAMLVF